MSRRRIVPLLLGLGVILLTAVAPVAALEEHKIAIERSTDPTYDILSARLVDMDLKGESLLLVDIRVVAVDREVYPSLVFSHNDALGNLRGYAAVGAKKAMVGSWINETLSFRILTGEVGLGDRLSIAQAEQQPPGRSTCEFFCDLCFSRAGTCANGVSSYSCSCSAEERHCNYVCVPSP